MTRRCASHASPTEVVSRCCVGRRGKLHAILIDTHATRTRSSTTAKSSGPLGRAGGGSGARACRRLPRAWMSRAVEWAEGGGRALRGLALPAPAGCRPRLAARGLARAGPARSAALPGYLRALTSRRVALQRRFLSAAACRGARIVRRGERRIGFGTRGGQRERWRQRGGGFVGGSSAGVCRQGTRRAAAVARVMEWR